MSASTDPTRTAKEFLEMYTKAAEENRADILDQAQNILTKSQLKKFNTYLKDLESDSGGEETPPGTADTGKGKAEEKKGEPKVINISDKELESFWDEIDNLDPEIDEQVLKDFQYVGFNPDTILRTVISLGKAAGKVKKEIMKDITSLCTIAVIKGSITDNNLKKMSDAGKRTYTHFETIYKLKRGGSKGLDPTVITVARVGAAFPGIMMKILLQKPHLAKKFSGPFGSKALPSYLRHQSAAACIPEGLEEGVKAFLLSLVTAFTADQTKTISKSKDSASDLYDRQENFVTQTHGTPHPAEAVRIKIFSDWTLAEDFDKIKVVAASIKKVKEDFTIISVQTLKTAISKMN